MALRQIYAGASTTVTASASLLKNTGHPAVHIVTLVAHGAFAGATLTPQIGVSNSADGAKWVSIPDSTMTANSCVNIEIADGFYFRVILNSASATATSVDCWMGVGRSTR
jgi:hypothetical protein